MNYFHVPKSVLNSTSDYEKCGIVEKKNIPEPLSSLCTLIKISIITTNFFAHSFDTTFWWWFWDFFVNFKLYMIKLSWSLFCSCYNILRHCHICTLENSKHMCCSKATCLGNKPRLKISFNRKIHQNWNQNQKWEIWDNSIVHPCKLEKKYWNYLIQKLPASQNFH